MLIKKNFTKLSLSKGKKAQGSNYIAATLVLMLFGFFNILAYVIFTSFITAVATTGFYTGAAVTAGTQWTNFFASMDYLIVFLFIVLVIAVGLTSYKVATSRAFFIITVILGIFWAFISYFFNYMFNQLVSPAVFTTAIGLFPRTLLICNNLHWASLIMIAVGSITLYGKRERGQFLD